MAWYRRDKEAVAAALQQGEQPDLATTMASGPLDELVASLKLLATGAGGPSSAAACRGLPGGHAPGRSQRHAAGGRL